MIKQLKYTISEDSKILVPLDQTSPREIGLDSGNYNLANSLNGIF